MNMRCKLFAGPILCMLALSVVLTVRGAGPAPGPVVMTAAAEDAEAAPESVETPKAESVKAAPEPDETPAAEDAEAVPGPVVPSTAADESTEDSSAADQEMLSGRGLSMDVTYGYENRAKGGRYVPVDVTIYNQGSAEFTGTLKLLTMESDYDVYCYEYPVVIPADGDLRKHVYVPMGNRAEQMFASVTDGEGSLVLHERVELDFSVDMPELFIGTLTDTPELLAV